MAQIESGTGPPQDWSPGMGPLAGYKVLDITQMIAGPFGCTMLADMGADVIKVEPIDGESTRHTVSVVPLEGLTFILLNRGKRSLPVDVRTPEGRQVIHRLVAQADVAVVGYRPDVCVAFGLDYATLSKLNPRLIYLQNTAFGPAGPMAMQGGYDIVVQGLSGLMALNQGVDAEGQPRQIVPAYADFLTGSIIAWAVTAAVLVRERTGEGQCVETSLLSSALFGSMNRTRFFEAIDSGPNAEILEKLAQARSEGRPWKDQLALRADRLIPGNVYYRAYATADSYLIVACLNNPTRVRFLGLTGLTDFRMKDGRLDLAVDPDEDKEWRRQEIDKMVARAEAVMRSKTTRAWLDIFIREKIPAGPLRFPEEVLEDEQVAANGYFLDMEHPLLGRYRTAAPPVRMQRAEITARSSAPLFGEHTREILASLGYSEIEILDLVEKRVVAVRED
jgi:crotonobetainyl-CoA:carnitine CoA-transferase CaiB-like acyl-CoA transferase